MSHMGVFVALVFIFTHFQFCLFVWRMLTLKIPSNLVILDPFATLNRPRQNVAHNNSKVWVQPLNSSMPNLVNYNFLTETLHSYTF